MMFEGLNLEASAGDALMAIFIVVEFICVPILCD
jgi:hypothetical protein